VALAANYAYVADGSAGLQVVDISNPAHCVRAGACAVSGNAEAVAVAGNYAYLANGPAGLQVIDVSTPANCVRVGGCTNNFYGLSYGRASGVAVAGNYAYVADANAGLQVIDISNPTNCMQVGGFQNGNQASSVSLGGKYAYVADSDGGLEVIDVSNPTHCTAAGGYNGKGSGYNVGVTVVGNKVYTVNWGDGLAVIASLPNVQFMVRVNATPGVEFSIETATNLVAPVVWKELLTTNLATMPFDFADLDVNLVGQPQKFYRVRQNNPGTGPVTGPACQVARRSEGRSEGHSEGHAHGSRRR
jgi:hypothetical protein